MVMYTSDVKSNILTLDWDVKPSKQQIVHDILNAPIEYGENFQNKKKGRGNLIVTDKKIFIDEKYMSAKAAKEISENESLLKAGFKFKENYIEVPESPISEQTSLM